jgi:cob(I)alamin adenosyltransferase
MKWIDITKKRGDNFTTRNIKNQEIPKNSERIRALAFADDCMIKIAKVQLYFEQQHIIFENKMDILSSIYDTFLNNINVCISCKDVEENFVPKINELEDSMNSMCNFLDEQKVELNWLFYNKISNPEHLVVADAMASVRILESQLPDDISLDVVAYLNRLSKFLFVLLMVLCCN